MLILGFKGLKLIKCEVSVKFVEEVVLKLEPSKSNGYYIKSN